MAARKFGYCPVCERAVPDAMSHFLTDHQQSAVPLKIVLDWIDDSSERCPQCYLLCEDVPLHFEIHHVPSVRLQETFEYDETFVRGDNNAFTCPWCPKQDYFSVTFEVRRHWSRTCNSTHHPPTPGARRAVCPQHAREWVRREPRRRKRPAAAAGFRGRKVTFVRRKHQPPPVQGR